MSIEKTDHANSKIDDIRETDDGASVASGS